MTSKDYIVIARGLRRARPDEPKDRSAWRDSVFLVAEELMLDNSRFDVWRFQQASGLRDAEGNVVACC